MKETALYSFPKENHTTPLQVERSLYPLAPAQLPHGGVAGTGQGVQGFGAAGIDFGRIVCIGVDNYPDAHPVHLLEIVFVGEEAAARGKGLGVDLDQQVARSEIGRASCRERV